MKTKIQYDEKKKKNRPYSPQTLHVCPDRPLTSAVPALCIITPHIKVMFPIKKQYLDCKSLKHRQPNNTTRIELDSLTHLFWDFKPGGWL